MATIDYKEKYEQALEKVRVMLGTGDYTRESLEYVFPELKESEDEKTKRILHSISSKMSFHLRDIFTEEEFQCFDTWSNAWLEKQAEQKPNYCHHEVDLSGCSDEYCKAYYDGWNNCNQQHAQLEAEQNPAEWSEEDERNINAIRTCIYYNCNAEDASNAITWLISLKDRVLPQPKQEWSEDERKVLKDNFMEKACDWLDENLPSYWGQVNANDTDDFIEKFRKAMED